MEVTVCQKESVLAKWFGESRKGSDCMRRNAAKQLEWTGLQLNPFSNGEALEADSSEKL